MKKIVIVGNSAAGISTAESIRKFDSESSITIVSEESYGCYSRCLLSYFLAGDILEEKIIFRADDFYKENKINLALAKKIVRLDIKKKRVIAEDKTQFDYDFLVLANGSSSKMPEIKGIHKKGVFGFRNIEDAKNILQLLPISDTACILGGGLIGLKAAYALKKRGKDIKVIVKSKQVLSQMLDEKSSEFFKQRLIENGIEIITSTDVAEILGNGDVKAVRLDSGKVIACQIVVVGKGVSPNINIAKETEIKTNEGILVDDYMKTNLPDIFACGDVAQAHDAVLNEKIVNALWPNAVEQGKVSGENIVGKQTKYEGSLGMNSVDFFGLPVISMGLTKPKEPLEELARINKDNNLYRKVLIKENRIVGAIFVGDLKNSGVFLKLIKEKIDISKIKNNLLDDSFDYTKIINLLPEEDNLYQNK